jgi:hypothetical protein
VRYSTFVPSLTKEITTIKYKVMKRIFTLLVLVFGLALAMNAQIEKTLAKTVNLNETHTAYVMLAGNVDVTEWEEDYIRLTTTITVANMSKSIVERLILVGRYTVETKTDKYGKRMVIEMPNVAHFVAVRGVDLVESYTFEINAPKGYKVVVKEDLNPNAKQNKNATLGQML